MRSSCPWSPGTPRLIALHGVGSDTAALLLVAAGDHPERLRSEAAWAHLCAAAPIPASSGKTVRRRLNPAGDRQANHALWRIVITRISSHPPTRAYVERRTAEGLSKKEIMRCLKRSRREALIDLVSLYRPMSYGMSSSCVRRRSCPFAIPTSPR